MRFLDSNGSLLNDSLKITSATVHQPFPEVQIEKLFTSTLEESQIELFTDIGQKFLFVSAKKITLTLIFEIFQTRANTFTYLKSLVMREKGAVFWPLAEYFCRVPTVAKKVADCVQINWKNFFARIVEKLPEVASKRQSMKQAAKLAVKKRRRGERVVQQMGGANFYT